MNPQHKLIAGAAVAGATLWGSYKLVRFVLKLALLMGGPIWALRAFNGGDWITGLSLLWVAAVGVVLLLGAGWWKKTSYEVQGVVCSALLVAVVVAGFVAWYQFGAPAKVSAAKQRAGAAEQSLANTQEQVAAKDRNIEQLKADVVRVSAYANEGNKARIDVTSLTAEVAQLKKELVQARSAPRPAPVAAQQPASNSEYCAALRRSYKDFYRYTNYRVGRQEEEKYNNECR